MPLPKISQPLIDLSIPSSKKPIKVRPMKTKEDKLLLMAKEDTNPDAAIMKAIKQVVNNCIVTEGIDIDDLTIFDLEWLFIKIRSVSVSNIVKVTYVDKEDEQSREFEVDLEKVEITWPEQKDRVIRLDDKYSLVLRFPSANLYSNPEFLTATQETLVDVFIKDILYKVVSDATTQTFKDSTPAEVQEFLDDLPLKIRHEIVKFIDSVPYIYYKIDYKNNLDHERKVEFRTLNDFFTFA